jgi:hypothetical protein
MRQQRRPLFAEGTKVPVSQTRIELEALLRRYGADQSLIGVEVGRAIVGFRIQGLQIKITLATPKGDSAKDQKEERRLWRALLLVIKAKLEACHSGIAVLEDEFLAYTVMADGQTVGEWARPQIAAMYDGGKMPPLLPAPRQ